MSTTQTLWTENVSLTFTDTSPADGVKSTVDIDLAANGYDLIAVQIEIEWDGSATDYADINVYNSSDSGSNIDTIVLYNRRVDAVAGTTSRISFIVSDIPYGRIEVDNQSNQEIASLTGIYAGRKWSNA